MARTIPPLGEALVKEIEAAWAQPQEDWARKRLLVVRLIAQHQMTTEQIAQVAGVSRKSVFNYRDLVVTGGVPALLKRDWAGGADASGARGGGGGIYPATGGRSVPAGAGRESVD